MAQGTKIEWTETTWNPVTGCTKISEGCQHCYAERLSIRLQAMGLESYKNGFKVTLHEHVLEYPRRWKKPRLVFVNSMSDLFHRDVPVTFIKKTFQIMKETSAHQYQILTKRSERLIDLAPSLDWTDNIWMGVTVENTKYTYRIDDLRRTKAAIKFISFEPLLGPIYNVDLNGIDWVIVGGESGPGARPMDREWVIEIRNQCLKDNVMFFFKQWGGVNKKKTGRVLDGKTWDQIPQPVYVS